MPVFRYHGIFGGLVVLCGGLLIYFVKKLLKTHRATLRSWPRLYLTVVPWKVYCTFTVIYRQNYYEENGNSDYNNQLPLLSDTESSNVRRSLSHSSTYSQPGPSSGAIPKTTVSETSIINDNFEVVCFVNNVRLK
jgi:hypothetical protein